MIAYIRGFSHTLLMNLRAGPLHWPVAILGSMALVSHVALADALDNWTSNSFPNVPLQCRPAGDVPIMWKVLFHGGSFIAAGTGPCSQDTPTEIFRSGDGFNWLRCNVQGYNGFFGATVTADQLIGVGFWGEIQLSSGDGANWSASGYRVPGSTGFGPNLNAVAYGAGRFVAVGDDFSNPSKRGVIATSTNGFNWEAGTFFLSQGPADGFVTVAFGNGMFWAATPTRMYRSSNGTSFTSATDLAGGARILCFGNGRFVRVVSTLLLVNTNGTAWVSTPQPTANPFNTVALGAGMFVATSGRDVASSVNGFDWIVRTNALPRGVRDLAFGNGIFMAVGNTSPINETAGERGYFISQPVAELGSTPSAGSIWVHGVRSREYEIRATNVVTSNNWPVVSRITLTNSPQWWTDTNPPANDQRFYRSNLVP